MNKLTRYFQMCLFVQKTKFEIELYNVSRGGHLGFPIGTILVIFIYKSPRYFLSRFESIGLMVQEKEFKIDFQIGGRGAHLEFPVVMILDIFDLITKTRLFKYTENFNTKKLKFSAKNF